MCQQDRVLRLISTTEAHSRRTSFNMLGLPRPVFLSNTVKSVMQEVGEMNAGMGPPSTMCMRLRQKQVYEDRESNALLVF